jgi:L-ascorbate metabolism protein UlaG (beta-lactamase superfamily)
VVALRLQLPPGFVIPMLSARVCFAAFSRTPHATSPSLCVALPLRPNPGQWNPNTLTATWIGHATVLINFYGTTILTDPVFFERVGVDLGFGVIGRRRLIAPALNINELPPIDLVLLSHAHMDHFDMPSLQALPRSAAVVTAKNTEDLLSDCHFKSVSPLGWGQSTRLKTSSGDLEVAAK